MTNPQYLDKHLKHWGVKGMKWGVRRNRNRPGGADGKEESAKIKDSRATLTKNLDSLKRERQWKKVLSEMDKLSTKDITTVTARVRLENDLKNLSRSKVGKKKDRDDYLRRADMSNEELKRKVTRLRAKEGLYKSVNDASKEQRELGEKITNIGKTLTIRYALKRSISPKDIFDAVQNPKDSANNAKGDLQKEILESLKRSKK